MFTKEYWNTRAKSHGHTGHAEPFYYCFDQQARLYAIRKLITTLNIKKNKVLDFGCGSGDFIDILKLNFEKIYAFDISEVVIEKVKKRFNQSNIFISDSFDQSVCDNSFDLILTVTVLQTLKKEDLEATVKIFSASLTKTGNLMCMEFFRNDLITDEHNVNKATTSEWKTILSQNKLKIISEINFYNPITSPTKSWYYYNTNLYLKILKPFKNSGFTQTKLTHAAKKLIAQHNDVLLDKESAFKIYIIQKENSCN
jgi:ubiquinone/menaquinone biosynthesis C-methylase UbiE